MMKKIDPKKKIILDADVIIHFSKGGALGQLPSIFSNKMYIPDIVYLESLSKKYQTEIDNLFNFKLVEELEIVCLTTMDFLAEAYHTGKMKEATCDFFIYTVKLRGSRLPCNSIAEFLKMD